ncbi:VRR-NUC domain-containing protein [Burkholderia thailandensis]|uniref:VRR-NUC domain-containing protein n=1 Tax=Burkholderia thailandensis TaxID=57975 RepID=UPI0002F73451|nr:VRR-NUC domain-containing protein [Burkholderia thailandensis]MCS3395416.1 VRR-NUC domain-containing protein [Burkholderia thailandensis]MCS6424094.1 VRR-NUC domain-containing protein [Burkholderia thailandensis]MCS6456778.1 VRR-NUC domain-containing protein [Burkholderia thailandensis]MCS6464254.1 VRR-NUC domain-containing protein [Burkholderia thailandensis]MCS6482021.1 VRR-NUC domain-containing protein [Burkholderia thailandensis]
MTDYAKGYGSGSTGAGEGRTNTVHLRRNTLSPEDRQALCSAICKCNSMPTIGASGQNLKQQCVSGRLKVADALSGHQSPYKAEINYDMTRDPPAPIMDSGVLTKAHDFLPGWIQKYWPGGLPGYKPGVGNIRRPDVVVVNDPSLPPTQDNLKSVVEVKFPGDTFSDMQRNAYERIAGDPAKVAVLGPEKCGCGNESQQQQTAPSTSSAIDDLTEGARTILRNGPPPIIPPTPVPVF